MNDISMYFGQDIAIIKFEFKEDKWDLSMQNGLEEAEMGCLDTRGESTKLTETVWVRLGCWVV